MIKILKMDHEWNQAIVEIDKLTYLMNPPYKSGKKIKLNEPIKEYLASFNSPDDAQRYMMTVFASQNLYNIMMLWKKYSAAGIGNVTLDKISQMATKIIESDLRKGIFPEKELNELFILHVGKGVEINKRNRLSKILNEHKMISPEKIKSYLLKIERDPAPYEDRIKDVLIYVENILKKGEDPRTANYILTSIQMNGSGNNEIEDKLNSLFSKSKAQITKKAKENGESLAMPWQKYVNPEPQFAKKGFIEKSMGIEKDKKTK